MKETQMQLIPMNDLGNVFAVIAGVAGVLNLLFKAKVREELDVLDRKFVRRDVQAVMDKNVSESITRIEERQDEHSRKLDDISKSLARMPK